MLPLRNSGVPGKLPREVMIARVKDSAAEMRRTLEGFKQPKKKIDDMVAGFSDGMLTAFHQLEYLGIIEIVDAATAEDARELARQIKAGEL